MANNERGELSSPKEPLHPSYQVLIVGAGLSGLALARQLSQRGIDYCLVDAERSKRSQNVHYLTTEASASSLGLLPDYYRQLAARAPITGYERYDATAEGLATLESLAPNPNRPGGFVVLSKQEIKDRVALQGIRTQDGLSVRAATGDKDKTGWRLDFQDGQNTHASILVDATGSKSRVARLTGMIDPAIVNRRIVRACYGAVLPYTGPEDMLLFADKYPPHPDLKAREGAGWVMPLGNQTAEVVVGWESPLEDAGKWMAGNPLGLLEQYAQWFSSRGIPIRLTGRTQVVAGTFSQEPLNYRKLQPDSNLLLFGESLGLNHPLNGYLISRIDDFARIASREIEARLNDKKWNPYEALFSEGDILYGPQVALSRKKMAGVQSGEGRSSATAKLQRFLVACLSPDGLWSAIDNGIPVKELLKGLLANPKYAPVVADIGLDYLTLLLEDNFYKQELALKIWHKLAGKRR